MNTEDRSAWTPRTQRREGALPKEKETKGLHFKEFLLSWINHLLEGLAGGRRVSKALSRSFIS